MQAIGFYLALPFLYLISLLPFPVLYLFSDLLFIILYYFIGYRKKTVAANLKNSFPEKSPKEIFIIEKKFYRYLCDLFLETLKTLSISKTTMLKHCSIRKETLEFFDKLHQQKKSFIIVTGHLGNWEWGGNAFSIQCRHQLYVIYHPLENKFFSNLMMKMRTRFGTKLIEMKNTFKDMIARKNEINATAFIADQAPSPENAYWTTFLNQETPVFRGTEVIARKLNYPVVFVNVEKIKRGRYEISAEMLFETPAQTMEGEISEAHTRRLEKEILKKPDTWIWSHRRWKYIRKN